MSDRKSYMAIYNQRRMHGPLIDQWFAETWQWQSGLCYLCGEALERDKAVVDHDYRCCPKNSSCSNCRRGLAHYACNFLIGEAKDDPERLRRIADNLERAQAAFIVSPAKDSDLHMVSPAKDIS